MIYGSVCSGIEAASVAWHPLGWRAAFFAEIEPFPRAVLAHHYPHVPLHGDFTTIEAGQYATIDVLVGGTPCQSFSVAGLRAGLDDERGNLALEFCRLARRLGPNWVVWENVPGVLSLDGGRAFASILGGLAECGYGLAYRVLDAQFVRVDGFGRAVPQRRRRVFVVGCLGDWRRAAAVLFERQSLRRDTPPRRQAGQGAAPTLAASSGGCSGKDAIDGRVIAAPVASCLDAHYGDKWGLEDQHINAGAPLFVSHALRADGFDASEDGTGRGTPLVPVRGKHNSHWNGGPHPPLSQSSQTRMGGIGGSNQKLFEQGGAGLTLAFDETQITSSENRCKPQPGDPCHPLAAGARPPTLAFNARQDPDVFDGHTGPLDTDSSTQALLTGWRVRRLVPAECARLQGFPDDYLDITYRGKPAADGPKYKALGNSFAVNVVRWIGQRIAMVDAIPEEIREAAE